VSGLLSNKNTCALTKRSLEPERNKLENETIRVQNQIESIPLAPTY